MAQENIIAKRYARGLAEHAREAGQVHEVREDLELLADLLDPHSGEHSIPELLDFAALSAKRGDTPKSELKGASKSMMESMSEKQLEELAHTRRKDKPEHVSKD